MTVLPHLGLFAFSITRLLYPSLPRTVGKLSCFLLFACFTSMLFLNPWARAARCRKASSLLGGKVIRYEVGDSVSDADLVEGAEQAAQIMLARLPKVRLFGNPSVPLS
jgi:hypothetical protein